MVSRWGWPSTCYLAIKLEKFTKCLAGQIVKKKLNNNKKKKIGWNRKFWNDNVTCDTEVISG